MLKVPTQPRNSRNWGCRDTLPEERWDQALPFQLGIVWEHPPRPWRGEGRLGREDFLRMFALQHPWLERGHPGVLGRVIPVGFPAGKSTIPDLQRGYPGSAGAAGTQFQPPGAAPSPAPWKAPGTAATALKGVAGAAARPGCSRGGNSPGIPSFCPSHSRHQIPTSPGGVSGAGGWGCSVWDVPKFRREFVLAAISAPKISARLSREGWMRFAGMEWECWGVKVPVPLEVTLPGDTEIPGSCLQSLQERGARSE